MRVALSCVAGLLFSGSLAADAIATERHSIVSEVTGRRERAGRCFNTRIRLIRLRAPAGSRDDGVFVVFADGHENISYDDIPAVDASRTGDAVRLCVRNLPAGPPECPRDDHRGIVYRAENLRTHMTWELPDSEHACGGA